MEWIMIGIAVSYLIVWPFALKAAYYNGVTDGYGYSKEPSCPGYAKAGAYLRKVMAHRWYELKEKL